MKVHTAIRRAAVSLLIAALPLAAKALSPEETVAAAERAEKGGAFERAAECVFHAGSEARCIRVDPNEASIGRSRALRTPSRAGIPRMPRPAQLVDGPPALDSSRPSPG